jgi:hypothetical protein
VTAVAKALRSFWLFWVDFLVGDAPELFIGVLLVIGGALLFRHNRPAGIAVVLVVTAGALVLSTLHGRRRD